MPTVAQLRTRANEIIDDTFDNKLYNDWFNQCQFQALSEFLYLPTRATLTKQPGEEGFTLPSNFKDNLKIVSHDVTYDIIDNVIFPVSSVGDSITVRYNRLPNRITGNPDQVPDIPVQFHSLYVFYGAMMAMLADEEPERYMTYQREFEMGVMMLKRYMDRIKSMSDSSRRNGTWVVIR